MLPPVYKHQKDTLNLKLAIGKLCGANSDLRNPPERPQRAEAP